MGKSSPPAAASPRPRRDASLRLAARAAGLIGLICLAGFSQRLARARPSFFSWKSSGSSSCHFRKASSSYGDFPLPGDAFRFLPCTNATVPPPLDDVDPEGTWRQRFDTDPAHWSWGNQTVSDSTSEEGEDDPYAGRGIFLCGYLDVPLDYTNASDLRIVRLVVTKFQVSGLAPVVVRGSSSMSRTAARATGVGKKSERTIVIEPGGPGGSGTSMAWRAAQEVTERLSNGTLDVLGWDPRGVNASLPSIACFPYDADRDRWALLTGQYREVSEPLSQLEVADVMNNATFAACRERHGDLPRFIGTASVARDLERIRAALGEPELTGYLVSYGTGIGQTYASMFPDSVGRLILDGTEYVRDHRELGGFGWTALDNVTDAWRDGFLGECLKAGPRHCALAKPQPALSPATVEVELTVRLAALDGRMQSLVKSLTRRPVAGYTAGGGPSLVTYSALVGAIYGAMYNPISWPALAQMLAELEAGNSTLAAAFLERSAWEYDPAAAATPLSPPPPPASDELGALVICADSYDAPQPPDGLAWWGRLWDDMSSRSWIAGNSRFFAVLPCRHYTSYWPTPAEVYRGDLNRTLRHPVLLLAETYDPATPLRNGRRLAAEMGHANARLVAHHGYGHSSARDRSSCTDAIARRFIMTGELPDEPEVACHADEKPYLYGVGSGATGVGVYGSEAWDPVRSWRQHLEEMRMGM